MKLPNQKDIQEAIYALSSGNVVAFPTDTVYGLGVNPFIKEGVERIFEIKGRSKEIALPLLLANIEDIEIYSTNIPNIVWKLAEVFLPGGLTIVLQKSLRVPKSVSGNTNTIALRVPNHPVPRMLASRLSVPITGTSANISGMPPCVNANCVKKQFGDLVKVVIDGGFIGQKESSTIIDATKDPIRLLRKGSVKIKSIEQVLGYTLEQI